MRLPWPQYLLSATSYLILYRNCHTKPHTISMLPVVPGPPSPSSRPTAALCRSLLSQHPQPLDAKTERQGRIRFIEYKLLVYTQPAVINDQRLHHFDTVALRNGTCIHKCRSAECMACMGGKIWRSPVSWGQTDYTNWLSHSPTPLKVAREYSYSHK